MVMKPENRLIYAKDAMRMIRNSQADNPWLGTSRDGIWKAAHDCALSCIDACDTVEAVKAVHGHWENLTGGMVVLGDCSECKTRQPVIGTNYCKECGAKMCRGKDSGQ